MRATTSTLLAALALLAPAAHAYEVKLGAVVVGDPWTTQTLRLDAAAAAYLTITNTGDRPVVWTGVRTPAAGAANIHQNLVDEDRVARMFRIEEVTIGPREKLVLEPDGLHVMLTALAAPLAAGQTAPLTLTFKDLGNVTVEVIVEPLGTTKPRAR